MMSPSRSDQEIKMSQRTLGEAFVMAGADYEPYVRLGAVGTCTAEIAKLCRDGLLHPSHHNLAATLNGILLSVTAQLDMAEQLIAETKPLHK